MKEDQENEVREFTRVGKEIDDLYHDISLRIGVSDSAFTIFYAICVHGDGCLQKDICKEAYVSKQTINSSIRRLEADGWIYLRKGSGRDKQICLTGKGKTFVDEKIRPVIEAEDGAFLALQKEERAELIRLAQKYVDNFRERERQLREV